MHHKDFICVRYVDEDRYVTVIGGLPFYRSTGNNSGASDTWFPFMGLLEFDFGMLSKGTFLKPYNNAGKDYFPEKISQYLSANNSMSKDFLTRFGNFETMCLSMLIGGGFWNEDRGKELKNFILKNYQTDVSKFSKHWESILVSIRKINSNKNVDVLSVDEPVKVNEWLKENGSKAIKDEYGSMNIDLKYINFRSSIGAESFLLIGEIEKALKALKNSFFKFYRPAAKRQKINVLEAAIQYLKGNINKDELERNIGCNSKYADAIGKSKTKELIEKTLNSNPIKKITKDTDESLRRSEPRNRN